MTIFELTPNDGRENLEFATGPETGFVENFEASYRRNSRTRSTIMISNNYAAELQPYLDEYKQASGEALMNHAALEIRHDKLGRPFDDRWDFNDFDKAHAEFQEKAAEFGIAVPSRQALDDTIRKKLPGIEARYFDVISRQSTGGFFGDLAGDLGSEFLMTVKGPTEAFIPSLLGGVAGAGYRSLVKAGLKDGAAAMAAVGIGQPYIDFYRKRYGMKYSFEEAFAATLTAGAGAVGLRVGFQGAGRALKAGSSAALLKYSPGAAFGRELSKAVDETPIQDVDRALNKFSDRDLSDLFFRMEQSGVQFPDDMRGAAQRAEREADIIDKNVFDDPDSIQATAEHRSRYVAATETLFDSDKQMSTAPSTLPIKKVATNHFDEADPTLQRLDVNRIEVDASLFQFKEGGDEFGVTDRLAGIERWDNIKAGTVLVYERANGKQFIADGHQRLALAKKIRSQDPNASVDLYGYVLRETDGITPEQGRVIAAMTNIAQGTGTYIDAAKVLRVDPARLNELPQQSQLVRVAKGLTNLSNDAFGLVVNDIVDARYAAIVGRLEANEAKQLAIMKLLKQASPANLTQAEAIVRQARELDFTTSTQENLFGTETVVESLFKERAKILDEALKILRKDKATFDNLVKNERDIVETGNVLKTQTNARRAEIDGQATQTIQTLAARAGAVSDALTAAAKQFKETGKAAPSAREFANTIRGAIQRGDIDGLPTSAPVRNFEPTAQSNQLAAARTERINDFDTPDSAAAIKEINRQENDLMETFGLDDAGRKELLDMEIDSGRILENGEPEITTVRTLFDDVEADEKMINRLKDCV